MVKLSEIVQQLIHQVRQSTRRTISKFRDAPPATANHPPIMNETFTVSEAAVKELMQRLEATQEGAYSCEETFALLDEYVELVAGNQDAAALMPLVRRHVEKCPDCREACEMLLRILESQSSSPAT